MEKLGVFVEGCCRASPPNNRKWVLAWVFVGCRPIRTAIEGLGVCTPPISNTANALVVLVHALDGCRYGKTGVLAEGWGARAPCALYIAYVCA